MCFSTHTAALSTRLFYLIYIDSVRAFKERMKLGGFADVDPEVEKRKKIEQEVKATQEKDKAESLIVGCRLVNFVLKVYESLSTDFFSNTHAHISLTVYISSIKIRKFKKFCCWKH